MKILDPVELAYIVNGHLGAQTEGTRCYTCDSVLRDDGVCLQCTERLGWLNIVQGVKALYNDGELVEVRAFPLEGAAMSGVFDNREALARAIHDLEMGREFKSIYSTLNPVRSGAALPLNQMSRATRTTRDADVASRKWLLIDLDPVRATATNSTDHELYASRDVADGVQAYLTAAGWPLPVRAYSGNGFHLLYRLADLPNTDDVTTLVNRVLRHLSGRFSTEHVSLDTAVGNAARITKCYGSTPRKGAETATRPWRSSQIQNLPKPLEQVTSEQLTDLVGEPPEPGGGDGSPRMAEDFDIEQFADFYDLSIKNPAGEPKDGRLFFYLDECPLAGRAHTGDPRKSALVLGDVLGFKCFSDECEGKGIGDLLRHFSSELNYKTYPHPLFAEREEIVIGGDGDDAEWHERAGTLPSSRPEPLVQETVLAPPTDELYGFEQLAPPAAVESPTQPDLSSMPIPPAAMYGWLADKARALQAPLGWAYPAMLTVFAAIGINMDDDEWATRPSLFTCLIGSPGDGKSRTVDRAIGMIQSLHREQIKDSVPGSDRGLLSMFAAPRPTKGEPPAEQVLKSWLIAQDEFRSTLNKIGIQNSSLATALCTAFYKDRLGAADKAGEQSILARVNLLGCLKCDDPGEFERLFGAETNGGLYDRFVYGIGQQNWKWDNRWRPIGAEYRRPVHTEISTEAEGLLDTWRSEQVTDAEGNSRLLHPGRLAEIASRVAIISASANHERQVSADCMRAALRFAEWQQHVRSLYQPGQAESKDAECTSAIIRKLDEVGKGRDAQGKAIYFSWNKVYKGTSWNRTFGPDLCRRMRFALVQMGTLEEEMIEPDPDSKKKEQAKATGRYRLAD